MDIQKYTILDSLAFGVIVSDFHGVCVWQNEYSGTSIFHAYVGKSMADIFPQDPHILPAVQQAAQLGTSKRLHIQHAQGGMGDGVVYTVCISPFEDNVVICIVDTKTNRYDEDGSVHRLVGMLAHEIKNPLSGIRGASQLLDTGEDGNLASLITQETDRISHLVNDLENLTLVQRLHLDRVNIHRVLDTVIRLAKTGFASDCVFECAYDPSLPDAWVDYDKISQVFLNVIKNASESMGGATVRNITVRSAYMHGVSVNLDGKTYRAMRIDISDTGCGIAKSDQKNIFSPYMSRKKGGNGLGLSVVSSIITSHGGRIHFDTSPKGTTFSIVIPLAQSIT